MEKKDILYVVVKDLVDFSILTKKVLQKSNFSIDILDDVKLLDMMCDEIINKYTKAGEKQENEQN